MQISAFKESLISVPYDRHYTRPNDDIIFDLTLMSQHANTFWKMFQFENCQDLLQ